MGTLEVNGCKRGKNRQFKNGKGAPEGKVRKKKQKILWELYRERKWKGTIFKESGHAEKSSTNSVTVVDLLGESRIEEGPLPARNGGVAEEVREAFAEG